MNYRMAYFSILAQTMLLFALGCDPRELQDLIRRQPRAARGIAEWEDKGPTPLAHKRYAPQGMAWLDGEIVFSNTWKDTRSRVYRIAPDSMSVKAYFDMPSEAVHTSGLESDGKYLWAVDFISNKAYKIDWAPSFSAQVAHVIGSFDTTLRGTSACGIVSLRGEKLLAMSDFRCSKRTIFVRHEAALAARSARDAIVFSYRNEGFSQGLAFDGQYLFESEKKFGVGVINKMDLSLLLQKGNARHATIRQYPAPSTGVEDLAWDGTHLWTSDESTFRFYTARLK